MDAAGRQAFYVQHPANGNPPLIGSTPANFNPKIDGYRHLDILRMMVFYNETFGIGVQDDLPTRAEKFRMFLTQF